MADPASRFNGFVLRRASTRRFVISLTVALGVFFAIARWQPGWLSVGSVIVPTPTSRIIDTPTPTPTSKPQAVSRYPYLGQAVTVDNISITPLTVHYAQGNGVTQPNTGDVFVIVLLQIVNHQDRDYTVIPNVPCLPGVCNFYVRDSEGRKNPPLPYDLYRTHLRSVVLQPNSSIEGSYTFEVSQHDVSNHALQLLYYSSPLLNADNLVHWSLKLPPSAR